MGHHHVEPDQLRALAAKVRLLALDVDGVLTDGRLAFDATGKECKMFHTRDGYGIRRVLEAGVEIAVISGRNSIAVEKRASDLGINHVELDAVADWHTAKGGGQGAVREVCDLLLNARDSVAND